MNIRIIRITDVSTNCENMVDALFRSHKYFPLVRRFQKWNILTSISCAVKYATIDAKKAGPVRPKTLCKCFAIYWRPFYRSGVHSYHY